jgi:hypothetical protein
MTASGAVDRIVVEPGDRLPAVLELIDAARRRLRALMTGVERRGRSAVASSGMLGLT